MVVFENRRSNWADKFFCLQLAIPKVSKLVKVIEVVWEAQVILAEEQAKKRQDL